MASTANKRSTVVGQDKSSGKGKGKGNKKRQVSQNETKLSFEFYLSEGNTYMTSEDYNRAIVGYSKALDIRPEHKGCLLSRSECYLRLGDTQSAISDANLSIADDPKFVKGILQKATIYYQMGEFEHALVLYHRGNKIRPGVDAFRLGIQLCQEAIENSIGENVLIKLEKKGDLSFFTELQQSEKDRDKQAAREMSNSKNNKQLSNKSTAASSAPMKDNTVKQLLEELYIDKKFLEKVLKDSETAHSKSEQNEAVAKISGNCLNFLDERASFWQKKQPTYARQKKVTSTSDIASEIVEDLQKTDEYFSDGDFQRCRKMASSVLRRLDKCSDMDNTRLAQLRGTAYSYLGNAYLQMTDLKQALNYHKKDYALAKQHKLSDAVVRSLDNIGRTLIRQEQFTEAVKVFEERSPMTKDVLELAWLNHELGRCHQQLTNFDESNEYGQKAFKAAQEADDKVWQLNALILMAEANRGLKKPEAALDAFERSLKIAESIDDKEATITIEKYIEEVRRQLEKQDETDDEEPDGTRSTDRQSPTSSGRSKPVQQEKKQDGDVATGNKQAVSSSENSYTVNVKISDVENAGTTASVYIELIGDSGTTRRLQLEDFSSNPSDKFKLERASDNEFTVSALDVGQVTALRIGHNSTGKGAGPHIAHVKVVNNSSKDTYMFACHQWLDKSCEDKATERELKPIPPRSDKDEPVRYHVTVRTGDEEDAGTDGKVFLQLFGDLGETDPLLLDTTHSSTNTFERDQARDFDLDAADVGQVRKIRIRYNGSSWLLEDIIVLLGAKSYKFIASQWLHKGNNDDNFEIELLPTN